MNTRLLTAFGVVDIVIGVAVWIVFDTAGVGVALIGAGLAVLVVAAVKDRGGQDPDRALRNEQADQQRRDGETSAGVESAEDRPPPTGG